MVGEWCDVYCFESYLNNEMLLLRCGVQPSHTGLLPFSAAAIRKSFSHSFFLVSLVSVMFGKHYAASLQENFRRESRDEEHIANTHSGSKPQTVAQAFVQHSCHIDLARHCAKAISTIAKVGRIGKLLFTA